MIKRKLIIFPFLTSGYTTRVEILANGSIGNGRDARQCRRVLDVIQRIVKS